MTLRYPVKVQYDNNNNILMQETSDTDLLEIRKGIVSAWLARLHANNTPESHSLRFNNWPAQAGYTGVALPSLTDTRLIAGASTTSTTAYQAAGAISTVSVAQPAGLRLYSVYKTTPTPAFFDTKAAFLYRNVSGELQEMTQADVDDTFIYPAISLVTSGTYLPYTITTSSSSPSGYGVLGRVFSDTRADVGLYTDGGIGEAQDQPITINSYYLHRLLSVSFNYYMLGRFLNGDLIGSQITPTDNNSTPITYLTSRFEYLSRTSNGSKITYSINSTNLNAKQMGSSIIDTKLNGGGNYQKRFVNADDYRSQTFPNGSAINISTYKLQLIGL
jgi:hypothetical protein